MTLASCSSEQEIGSTSSAGVIGANPLTRGGSVAERQGDERVLRTDIIDQFVGFGVGDTLLRAPGDLGRAQDNLLRAASTAQLEYRTQGVLHQVGSVYAYARGERDRKQSGGLTGFAIEARQPNLGKGSHINIISGLGTGSFVLENSLDLTYPEFSSALKNSDDEALFPPERVARVHVRVVVNGNLEVRTVDVACADLNDCQIDINEVNDAVTDLLIDSMDDFTTIVGDVYSTDSNLRFIDERVIGSGTDADNGAGEGVIALINGLRGRGAITHGIAPDATVSIRGADNSVAGEVLAALLPSLSAPDATRGNVIIMDRTLASDYSALTFFDGVLGQHFMSSEGQFVSTDANKLSAYVERQGRGRFAVQADESLGAFSSFFAFVVEPGNVARRFKSGTEVTTYGAGVHTVGTAGRYRLPVGTTINGRTLTEAEEVFLDFDDIFTLPAGGGDVTLPSVLLDARGNPVYGQEAQNRELVRQLIGGYYGATGDNDILGVMLDNMLAHKANNQDIYIFEAGLGEETSFSGLPIIMEA